jgi:hypothetical protein
MKGGAGRITEFLRIFYTSGLNSVDPAHGLRFWIDRAHVDVHDRDRLQPGRRLLLGFPDPRIRFE